MIKIHHRGSFRRLERMLTRAPKINYASILERYGQEGVRALALNTPLDSGLTALSWKYEVHREGTSLSIMWTNSNVVNGVPIAIIIQYGHATRNGGYVQGRDYINPALRHIFDKMANTMWEEVIG